MGMKKFIVFVILVAVAILLARSIQLKESVDPATQQPNPMVITMKDGVFEGSTFTFTYPADAIVAVSSATMWRNNTQEIGTTLAEVTIPDTVEPKTNFRGARFTVGMSNESNAIRDCLIPTNGERAKGTVVIDGVTFNKITLTDAGAGNYYDTTSYRAMHNNNCYAIEYTIHSTNLRNYDPGTVSEFDTQAIVKTLEQMVQSFKFI